MSEKEKEIDKQISELMEGNQENAGKKDKKKKVPWKKGGKRKLAVILAVLAVGGFAVYRIQGGARPALQAVTTEPLTTGSIQEKLSITGPVTGTESVEVVSSIHAEILEIKVKEGDHVEKGQILAVLDPTDIQKQVDIAQNEYNLAVSNYQEKEKEAKSGYAKAKQDYQTAQNAYNRQSVLFASGDITAVDMETAENARADAKRQVDSFTVKNGKAVANESFALQIKNAEFTLEQKKRDLENTTIVSPISGTVVRVNVRTGRFADAVDNDKPMFAIDNLDTLEMQIKVSEYSIGKVKVGQPVVIKAEILNGESVQGEVTAISPTGEEKGGGSTERIIPTTVKIMEKGALIAGINAKAEILLAEADKAQIVSGSSILQNPDGSCYIATVKDGVVHLVEVETGVESDIQTQILPKEELPADTQVIMNPDADLTEGLAVMAVPLSGASAKN